MSDGLIPKFLNSEIMTKGGDATPLDRLITKRFNDIVYPFFGDEGDGDFSSTGNVTPIPRNGFVTYDCRNFMLNEGHTLMTSSTNKGIIIRCTGTCTINGIVDQTGKVYGVPANITGTAWVDFSAVDTPPYSYMPIIGDSPIIRQRYVLPSPSVTGGAGGYVYLASGTKVDGGSGVAGSPYAFGGGRGGTGGTGATGNTSGGGGGAGGLGGGNIIIIANDIIIGSTGVITSRGTNGSNGSNASSASGMALAGGGGGGSGGSGGNFYMFYGNTYSNTGTTTLTGGTGGTGIRGSSVTGGSASNGISGVNGSSGTIQAVKVA